MTMEKKSPQNLRNSWGALGFSQIKIESLSLIYFNVKGCIWDIVSRRPFCGRERWRSGNRFLHKHPTQEWGGSEGEHVGGTEVAHIPALPIHSMCNLVTTLEWGTLSLPLFYT